MPHRVFIAINLPEDIKKKLADYQRKWPELPCRWTKKDNLHITLIFLGYVSNDELVEVCNIVKETVQKHSPFFVKLNKILYGPPKKTPPRMVWVEGEKSPEFTKLRDDLEKTLSGSDSDKIRFSAEERAFSPRKGALPSRGFTPHITLGRIKTWEWRQIEPEERHEISKDIDLNFSVNSIEIMESQLERTGPEYTVLESLPLAES